MTALFAICDDQWALVRSASSPMGLKASTGKTYSNAALASVEDLRANYVLVIDQGTKPDQEWQTVTGNPTVVINGDPDQPETMTATLQYSTQPISLDAAKAKLESKVKEYKFRRMERGITFDVGGTAYVVQTDERSLALLDRIAKRANANQLENGQVVRMADNSSPLLTQQQIIDLDLAVSAMLCDCTDAQTEREYAIDALPNNLQAHIDFDCTAGFPAFPAVETE
ncbi:MULTISPECIES: DUF4376 domain-containing protein [Thalassospira]|uniref:DUF4376 domain-containing protein n=1 Tax=Thalassospira TaxID=168934 RepID=UPI00080FD492|nr:MULTISPECIES: DUF4376 domain-containing protein [Thalassospira]OCK08674.1 hypothetical protein KO164_2853 [Thalassospira sp. KO164]OCK10307.1 hypothetical protein KO164_0012 [Thalassospira sp. KO164]SEC85097.1 protein of unknown function [Thalassospira permensis]SEE54875.1 protein of unknown function [Thalassospira permensis]